MGGGRRGQGSDGWHPGLTIAMAGEENNLLKIRTDEAAGERALRGSCMLIGGTLDGVAGFVGGGVWDHAEYFAAVAGNHRARGAHRLGRSPDERDGKRAAGRGGDSHACVWADGSIAAGDGGGGGENRERGSAREGEGPVGTRHSGERLWPDGGESTAFDDANGGEREHIEQFDEPDFPTSTAQLASGAAETATSR